MFNNQRGDQLKTLYRVFSRVPETLPHVIAQMKPYIDKVGSAIVSDGDNLKNPIQFTQKLLDFKLEVDNYVQNSFANNMLF